MTPYQICGSARPAYFPRTASAVLVSAAKAFSCSAAGRRYLIWAHSPCSARTSSSRAAKAAMGKSNRTISNAFMRVSLRRGRRVPADDGKLAAQRAVDQPGKKLVEPREEGL